MALRLLGLDKGLWIDEFFSIRAASDVSLAALRDSDKPPLYPLLLRAWITFGDSDAYLRLLSIATSVVTLLALVHWLLRSSLTAAVVGAVMFGCLPILLRYGQEVRGYGLLLLWTVIAFDGASRLPSERGHESTARVVGCALALAVATHLIGIFLVGAIVVYSFLSTPRERWVGLLRRSMLPIVGLPTLTFAVFYFVFLQRTPEAGDWWMPSLDLELVSRTASEVLGTKVVGAEIAALGIRPGVAGTISWAGATTLVILLLAGGSTSGLPSLAAALVYWGQLAAFSLISTPIFLDRTTLPGLIPWLAFLALQISGARGWRRATALGLVVGGCSLFVLAWCTRLAWVPQERWRQAAEVVAKYWEPEDVVLTYPTYTTGVVARYLPEVVAASTQPVARLDTDLIRLESQAGGVFLIVRLDAVTEREIASLDSFADSLSRSVGRPEWEENLGTIVITRFVNRGPPTPPGTR